MITEVNVTFYEFDGKFGTMATYLSDGEPMSARFPQVMTVPVVIREIQRRRQQLAIKPLFTVMP